VYLPVDSATALVGPGDRVLGGETVIARWNE
jgi:phosphatidylserine decarboxylase